MWMAQVDSRLAKLEAKFKEGRCPESFETCQAYFVEISAPGLAQGFWDHGLMAGWTQGRGGLPIRNWKAAARTWKANGRGNS